MFIDVDSRLWPTRIVPVDKDCLSVGTIKAYWIPVACLALFFESNPAVVTTSGVEDYLVGAHHAVNSLRAVERKSTHK